MKAIYFSLLLSFILVFSCSPYRYVDIQVLDITKVKLPHKVNSLAIIGPSMSTLISDSSKRNPQITNYAELIINNFRSELKSNLKQSPVFSEASIYFPENPVSFTDSIQNLPAGDNKGNLLLKYSSGLVVDTANTNFTYRSLDGNIYDYGYYLFYYRFLWRVYNIDTKETVDWHQFSNSFRGYRKSASDDGSEAIKTICKDIAASYAHYLAPFWVTEERIMFYSSNRLMKEGYRCFCVNDNEGAISNWLSVYKSGTRKLASMAAYNIALVYEMQDDLNSSEEWLIKSVLAHPRKIASDYLEKIRSRKLARLMLEVRTE